MSDHHFGEKSVLVEDGNYHSHGLYVEHLQIALDVGLQQRSSQGKEGHGRDCGSPVIELLHHRGHVRQNIPHSGKLVFAGSCTHLQGLETSRNGIRLKNNERTSKCQVFSSTVHEKP